MMDRAGIRRDHLEAEVKRAYWLGGLYGTAAAVIVMVLVYLLILSDYCAA